VASLLSSAVTETTVQSVIEHTTSLVSHIVEGITADIRNMLSSKNVLNVVKCESLLDRIQQNAKPFGIIDSRHKCVTHFTKQYGIVQAKSIFLGNRYDQTLDPKTGSMRQIIKRDMFQYVPILKLIKLLLNDSTYFGCMYAGSCFCWWCDA